MKSTFVLTTAAATGIVLFALPLIADGQDMHGTPPTARATMQHNANQSAQATTDMSYGGVTDSQGAAGGLNATPMPDSDAAPMRSKSGLPSTHAPSH